MFFAVMAIVLGYYSATSDKEEVVVQTPTTFIMKYSDGGQEMESIALTSDVPAVTNWKSGRPANITIRYSDGSERAEDIVFSSDVPAVTNWKHVK